MKLAVSKIKTLSFAMLVLVSLIGGSMVMSQSVSAQAQCPGGSSPPDGDLANCPDPTPSPGGGGTADEEVHTVKNDCNEVTINEDNCGIIKYLVIIINVLSAMVGIVVVGSLVYAGIQYSAAGSDPQKVSAAKDRIRNSIIALLFFVFMYALLNYLIPGGVLQ